MFFIGLGFSILIASPFNREGKQFTVGEKYKLQGKVEAIKETDYYKWVTLKAVEQVNSSVLKSKVQIRMPLTENITPNDWIKIDTECIEIEPQMNPSDFDYISYLKAQGIVASFKLEKMISIQMETSLFERLHTLLHTQLQKLYTKDKIGIMEAALIGDDTNLQEHTKELYQAVGISHVLCISGFHVGVITTLIIALVKWIPVSYSIRQFIIMIAIWFYAIMTGGATSTIRATVIVTILLLGKCLWQEEDSITSIAAAALIILLKNPYQLFMSGFQLSFMAVLGITLCNNQIEKKEVRGEWKYPRWQRTLMIWASVEVFTWPILAYHFYEIPFLLSLVNLFIIPLFSILIIEGWICLGLSFITDSIAHWISEGIENVLAVVEILLEHLIKLPLGTLCTGRPSFLEYSFYSICILGIGAMIWGYFKRQYIYQCMLAMAFLGMSQTIFEAFIATPCLKITSLYVGQGDCTIIEMPQDGLLMIDGGNFGKGQVAEAYIKYLGYDVVQGVIVSHSDADHIGGILELLDSSLEINQIFVSERDQSEYLNDLIQKCNQKRIPICYLKKGEEIWYDDLKIECLAPSENQFYKDVNDASLVCKMSYQSFSALFTGDKSKESEEWIYDELDEATLLKVSHHGSKTGTSEAMLLKLQPRYAMISCGRHNLYGHPHQEVLSLLEAAGIDVSRTDEDGAICYETDGIHLKERRYRKDA